MQHQKQIEKKVPALEYEFSFHHYCWEVNTVLCISYIFVIFINNFIKLGVEWV